MPSNKTDENLTGEERDRLAAQNKVASWLKEIQKAKEREKRFRKKGNELMKIFECEQPEKNQFNILFSNTETMSPALYNATPTPVVQRRYKDEDPVAAESAKVGRRLLQFFLDPGASSYTPFDDAMKRSVLESLVPGRGQVRYVYETKVSKVPAASPEEKETEKVDYELVCTKTVAWDRFLHGYAKVWEDVPWVDYIHLMSREELIDNFGSEIGNKVPLDAHSCEGDSTEDDKNDDKVPDLAQVHEIWDKSTKKVIFISEGYKDSPLREVDDPLQLQGFFDCARPLQFIERISSLTPLAPYCTYEKQAEELNQITLRIQKLVRAMRLRGIFDSTIGELEKLFQADDNVMIPAENVASLQQGAGGGGVLEKALWLVPIDKYIGVLQQLYAQRAQVKQVIYEISGVSDIMRGSTQASETATAQDIKNQWGSLRIKRPQKEVNRFARDGLRIVLEIAVTKYSIETIAKMTGMKYPTQAEKMEAQAAIAQVQAQGGEVPPEFAEKLNMPSWEEIIGLLKDDLQRNYRIDIETNSTIDAEATEDKQNLTEFLNALAQFLNGIGPLVQQGMIPFDVAKSIMLFVARRYRAGDELEDKLRAMKQPPPPQPEGQGKEPGGDPEALAAADKVKAESTVMAETNKQKTLQMDAEFAAAEHAYRMEELAAKRQVLQVKTQNDLIKAATPPAPPAQPSGDQ